MDEALRKALDELDDAEREMVDGETWQDRDPDDWFYTVACQLAYHWRGLKNPKEEKPGRFLTGVTFSQSPLDGSTIIVPKHEGDQSNS